ncbi:MAG: exodeoxyribonuclease VII large subunit [Desulfuromonadales bacterium]|nr:exodeoxyribonuclease VII large subunit [Desulfuromonadales bacterium]
MQPMNEVSRKLTVSGLVALLQDVVESNFVDVEVEGEVSNFSSPASGHWYFSLKDERSQLRAVMFRGRNRHVDVRPKDGLQILCKGSLGVYLARGEVQLIVERLTTSGIGDLQKAYEDLKHKLSAEGLFAVERKRPLPAFPTSIGIVTSATGAAIHDIMNVIRRRAPGLHILLRPVRVQGEGAAAEIAAAIEDFNQFTGPDVLIVGRGGGSLEDLWAFNEEVVARAIAASQVPVISAVGHEVDVTISDLVADVRAATPSVAAEMVAKSRLELEAHLDHLAMRLQSQLMQRITLVRQQLDSLQGRLRFSVRDWSFQKEALENLSHQLQRAMQGELRRHADQLGQYAGRLQALSPLNQLERGYVIASRTRDAAGLSHAEGLALGEDLWLRFVDGRVRTKVVEVES